MVESLTPVQLDRDFKAFSIGYMYTYFKIFYGLDRHEENTWANSKDVI